MVRLLKVKNKLLIIIFERSNIVKKSIYLTLWLNLNKLNYYYFIK